MIDEKRIVDVAIVGYGPVSKLLATLLGQKGWKVGVYERFPKSYPLPRAVHLDDEISANFTINPSFKRIDKNY